MPGLGLGANTTYPGGDGSSIRTAGGTGIYAGGRGRGGGGWLEAAARRRVGQQLEGGAIENQSRQFALTEARRGARQARAPKLESQYSQTGSNNLMRRNAMSMSNDAMAVSGAQRQAMMRPAPSRQMTGFNVIPCPTLDPFAMSGAQRQMFLPQGSSFNGIPTPSDTFGAARAQGEGEQAAQFSGIQQMLALMAGSQPGFMGTSPGYAGPQSTPQRQADERELRMRQRPDARLFNPQSGGGAAGY